MNRNEFKGLCRLCGLPNRYLERHHWFDSQGVRHERYVCQSCNKDLAKLCREYYPPWSVQVKLWQKAQELCKSVRRGLDLDRLGRPERLRDMLRLYGVGESPSIFDLAVKYDVSMAMVYKDRCYLRKEGLLEVVSV